LNRPALRTGLGIGMRYVAVCSSLAIIENMMPEQWAVFFLAIMVWVVVGAFLYHFRVGGS